MSADGRRYPGTTRVMGELMAAKTALKTVLAKRGKMERVPLPMPKPAPVRSEARELDAAGALRDTENALRDFISAVLADRLGANWFNLCGVSAERVRIWAELKATESGRLAASGLVEERLIYYADFDDVRTILHRNWNGPFAETFGDWNTMAVWLAALGRLRDPEAQRRELLPYQKHLAVGVAGEIRTRLVRYRSKRETSADCFPRIESVRDSLGNLWTAASPKLRQLDTKMALRPGDEIGFVITARDPEDAPLEYGVVVGRVEQWGETSALTYTFTEADVAASVSVELKIRSRRPYHASSSVDDEVAFEYQVLPPRGESLTQN